ncbi:MAG TPA: hypothetical protein VJH33_03980 [Candidatus Paceibacterota bacterium]
MNPVRGRGSFRQVYATVYFSRRRTFTRINVRIGSGSFLLLTG